MKTKYCDPVCKEAICIQFGTMHFSASRKEINVWFKCKNCNRTWRATPAEIFDLKKLKENNGDAE